MAALATVSVFAVLGAGMISSLLTTMTTVAYAQEQQQWCYDVIIFTTPIIVGDHRCFDNKADCKEELKSRPESNDQIFRKRHRE